MTIPMLITANLDSERLPGKYLLKLGQKTVIEHVMDRAIYFGFDTWLCVPAGEQWDFPQYNIFRGHPEKIPRLYEWSHEHHCRIFNNTDGDDPFFSCEETLASMYEARESGLKIILPTVASESGSGIVGTSYNLDGAGFWRLKAVTKQVWPQRITLDYEEDYHLLCAINSMVGGFMAPRWAVDELFVRNPDLHKINWHRNTEWKARQLNESSNGI